MSFKKIPTDLNELEYTSTPYMQPYGKFNSTKLQDYITPIIINQCNMERLAKAENYKIKDPDLFSIPEQFNVVDVLHKVKDVVKHATQSDGVKIYIADNAANEIYLSLLDKNHDATKSEYRRPIQEGTTLAAYVAFTREIVLLNAFAQSDDRFPELISMFTRKENPIKAIFCIPIMSENELLAVLEAYRYDPNDYENDHLQFAITTLGWLGIAYKQYNETKILQVELNLHNKVVKLASEYYSCEVSIKEVMLKFLAIAKESIFAERGMVYIIQNTHNLSVDVYEEVETGIETELVLKPKIRLHHSRGYASKCIQTQSIINSINPLAQKSYDIQFDRRAGTPTRSIICIPICDKRDILGVIQFFNKTNNESAFSKQDEELLKTFSAYFSLLLHGVKMDEKIERNNNFNKVIRNTLAREMNNSFNILHTQHYLEEPPENFDSFAWYSEDEHDKNKIMSVAYFILKQITDPQLFESNKILNFFSLIQRCYRGEYFHCLEHGLSTMHSMYLMMKNNIHRFDRIEIAGLLIASLCHAIDHHGHSNFFLIQSKHPLSKLYDDACMQHQCAWLTIEIMNISGAFSNCNQNDYTKLVRIIEDGILSTDEKLSTKNRIKLNYIFENEAFHFNNIEHKKLLRALMVNSSHLSYFAKPFDIAKRKVEYYYKERYAEARDLKELGLPIPTPKNKNNIPAAQLKFLQNNCLPTFKLLKQLIDGVEYLYDASFQFTKLVEDMVSIRGGRTWFPDSSCGKLLDFDL